MHARHFFKQAFTLVELLLSIALLLLIVTLLGEIITRTQNTVSRSISRMDEFEQARAALDTMSHALSQALMDASLNYDSMGNPTAFVRASDHHFILGPASDLVPAALTPENGQAVFFQSPLGHTGDNSNDALRSLHHLVNCWGFYLQHGSDLNERPGFLQSGQPLAANPERHRFRLMQYAQPAQDSQLYRFDFRLNQITNKAAALRWFQQDLAANSKPIATNVLALILVPYAIASTSATPVPDTHLAYDSREAQYGQQNAGTQNRLHQLPPKIQILLIVTNEKSYAAFEQAQGSPQSAALTLRNSVFKDRFTRYADLETDLAEVTAGLSGLDLHHQILTTTIALRGSKWMTP